MTDSNSPVSNDESKRYKIKAGIFLGTIAGVSALVGFSRTLSSLKKSEQKVLEKCGTQGPLLIEGGTSLAMRALGWGTFYAVLGTSAICYGIWKLSGANNMEEFRHKMGSRLPKLSKDEPPASKTDFEGLTDLMKYLSTWGKE